MHEQDVGQIVYRALDLVNTQAVKTFRLPSDTYIGPGAVSCIGEAIASRGVSRVFVVIDEVVQGLGIAEGMFRSLKYHNIAYFISQQPPGEPQSDNVEIAAKQFIDSNCDGMVAIGGGSALDAAKAIALLAANPGICTNDMLNPDMIKHKRAPLIAVPTTAGTGSEATNVTVITDSIAQQKRIIAHSDLVPDLALIDACLALRVPPFFTAATGVDALTHAIEAYVTGGATPLTKALAYRAISLIGEALPIATGQGDNIQARESMALASYMAGVAFSNAGLGLTHSTAHQIGPKYDIPHGVANAIMLPAVMQFNELVCKKEFAEIGLALTGEIMNSSEVILQIKQLIVDLGLPANLASVGGKVEDFEQFAEAAIQDYCTATNPRTVSKQQIIAVYKQALNQ